MACQRRCPRPCSRSLAYTLALGSSFVALGTSRILLLKFSANADDKYDFLPASVNMLAEALKLLFCLVMSLRVFIRERRSCRDLRCSSASALLGSLKWAVPAFLYFLDNLIIFYVMTYLQPAMAVLFSNFVILTTAVLFRLVLKVSLRERVRSSLIWEGLRVEPLLLRIERSQMRWPGHLIRTPPGRLLGEVFRARSAGRRRRTRRRDYFLSWPGHTSRFPLGRAGGSGWGEDNLGFPAEAAAPATRPLLISGGKRMGGWRSHIHLQEWTGFDLHNISSDDVLSGTLNIIWAYQKRRLSWVQWAALVILFLSIVSLTTGSGGGQTSGGSVPGVRRSPLSAPTNSCLLYTQLLEQMRNSSGDDSWASRLPGRAWRDALAGKLRSLGAGHVLLLLQCFVSAAANIYNEKILKDGEQLTESIYVQNSKLYAFGVLFNGLTLAIGRESRGLAVHCGVLYGHNVYSLALVLVTAPMSSRTQPAWVCRWPSS
ncbi:UDP-sugar transporter protein SLC35A5 isoform X2 [Phyllopteryx taeniolatus]|uniref:UDP-sugar transporter protein SLC35A5 isoform X2 n=1 Tax=Phyllopteryx taeniolatus TaxID=161469 RepID=UPI002AD2EA11|nr:UDP-sugar transporter protein SLC35A5 isoform X2 [Phyllopteryx taeniolatus]